jgi:hypothetical protein
MTRSVCLFASVLLAGSVTVFAQSHDQTHPQGRHHDRSSHDPIDPQLHAAMHALIGTWTGTLASHGGPATMHLTATNDPDGRLALTLASDSSLPVGTATDVALSANSIRWTQALGEGSCAASASLENLNAKPSGSLRGSLTCADGTFAFALEKSKK